MPIAADLVSLADPLQGTDSDERHSHGNTLPLIARPWGMTHWTPQTGESRWLYQYHVPRLQGIRATHQPSPWIGDYGQFTLMPIVGPVVTDSAIRASSFTHAEERAQPDYYRVYLKRYRTTIELSPTERCAAMRMVYPSTDRAHLVLDTFTGTSDLHIDKANRRIVGCSRSNCGGVVGDFGCRFIVEFDTPIVDGGTCRRDEQQPGHTDIEGEQAGVWVTFDLSKSRAVNARIATSFISHEQAQMNLDREVGSLGFDDVRAASNACWNELLGRIEIDGGLAEQRRTFYSALYRALLFPRHLHEFDANGRPHHYSPYDGAIHPGVMSADNGFWDTYRTVYPLLSLVYPDHLGALLQGWVNAFSEGGWLPKWSSPGYRACMIGTHADVILADAVVKNIDGFDHEQAYRAVRQDVTTPGDERGNWGRVGHEHYLKLGYVPDDLVEHGCCRTLDFAYDDFAAARMAVALGKRDDVAAFVKKANNWRNVYDQATTFMRGRRSDGAWIEPFDPIEWGGPYVEGAAWQHNWTVPHDTAGLIAAMGGRAKFIAKLEQMLAMPADFNVGRYPFEIHEMSEMAAVPFGQYAHSNQPVHHVLYLFAAAGAPHLTQYWTRRVMNELYSAKPDGLCGDEDNGEMSCWYLFSALGLYPLCPGHPSYVLGAPLHRRAVIHLATGRDITIEAPLNSAQNMYARSITCNGKPHGAASIAHATLAAGCTLGFEMSDAPDRTPLRDDALPYSLSTHGIEG